MVSKKKENMMHQKHFVRILLFFYLFSSFVSATHIHHDVLKTDADCKVCIVVKNLHSADVPSSYVFENEFSCHCIFLVFQSTYYTLAHIKGYNAQAPPSFS